jgi:hypothetical protein
LDCAILPSFDFCDTILPPFGGDMASAVGALNPIQKTQIPASASAR